MSGFFLELYGRHRLAMALTPVGCVLGVVVGFTVNAALGTALVLAVLFVAALAIGQGEARRHAAEAKQALHDQVLEIEHKRATAERLRTWVLHVVPSDGEPDEDARLERGA